MNVTSFHLMLEGEIIVNRSCFHLYKIIYKLMTFLWKHFETAVHMACEDDEALLK